LSTNHLRVGVAAATLVLALVGAPATAATPPVSCKACFVVDDAGRVLWRRAAHLELPNASTTKMVTALVAVRRLDLDTPVEVSSGAAAIGGGGHDLQAGDVLTANDLLVAMLLSSSNEAAGALAEAAAGSQEAFVTRMNRFVSRLGAADTSFVNPHGLDAVGHHSSASDLALIAARLLDEPVLAEIVATSRTTISTPRGRVTEVNRNLLLDGYPGAIGVKTGRTLGAGNVLVAAARRAGRTIIAVAMGSEDATNDAARLLDHGFDRAQYLDDLAPVTVLRHGTAIGAVVLEPGATPVVAAEDVNFQGLGAAGEVRFLPDLDGNIRAGTRVGTILVTTRGQTARVPAIALDPIRARTRGGWATELMGSMMRGVATLVGAVT
jgi:serine-type D-Ala-D-Ala carboxypeptidase (penicillin-binding protein 5/6)